MKCAEDSKASWERMCFLMNNFYFSEFIFRPFCCVFNLPLKNKAEMRFWGLREICVPHLQRNV